jgi:hypothetical protein
MTDTCEHGLKLCSWCSGIAHVAPAPQPLPVEGQRPYEPNWKRLCEHMIEYVGMTAESMDEERRARASESEDDTLLGPLGLFSLQLELELEWARRIIANDGLMTSCDSRPEWVGEDHSNCRICYGFKVRPRGGHGREG